jgi:tetratricopeptide (TPR) repeat protein
MHRKKVLSLVIAAAIAGTAFAPSANAVSPGYAGDGVAALHLQINQTGARLLNQPPATITPADLQALLALAQKYFSNRKEREWALFNQRLEDQRLHLYSDDSQQQEPHPSVEETLITVFQRYISFHSKEAMATNGVASLTQLRNLLRQLQTFGGGRLSGSTWLYNSPLPAFAARQLQPLDQQIIKASLSSADALRKKHQYAAAEKIYKTLLADYANTPHERGIKVLLDAAIVEDYNYQAKQALAKHDYKTARAALKRIVALYPDSDYSVAAEKAMQATVPAAVSYFKKEGTAVFHPEGHPGVPQTRAAEFFSQMLEEDPDGPQADYATYYWARALGTEGKIKEALGHLQDFDKKFQRSKLRPDALFLQSFLLASAGINQYAKAADLMEEFARLYPHHQQSGDALWSAAFYHAYDNHFKEALACLEQLKKYPKDKHQKYVAQWESTFRNKIQTGGKWP